MYASFASPREQAASAFAAFAIVAGIVFALVLGLRVGVTGRVPGALASVFVEAPREAVKAQPKRKLVPSPRRAAKGDPSPRNLRNRATQVVVPPPRIPLVLPPSIPVAQRAGIGSAAASGASDRPGPGQGAGGIGDGLGGGGQGGDGDGDGGAVVGPRQIRGKLSFRDLPPGTLEPGREAAVGVRYTVNVDGRVTGCVVDEPSGYPTVDAMTCRLIEQRFVFRPARDRERRPVRSAITERHTWFMKERDRDD